MKTFVTRPVVIWLLGAALLACGDDDDSSSSAAARTTATDAAPTTAAPTTAAPTTAASTTAPIETAPPTTAAAEAAWERVVPGGDCQCADGSEFSFWVRRADPSKVVFYFQGGGACFSAESCSFTDGTYEVTSDAQDDPAGGHGLFDLADARNPLADHSFVFVPYCTGDVHIGDATTEYAPDLTVQHKGYVNGNAALDHLVASFPDAAEVLVTGESAGSVASPLYAGLVADRLPDARVTVLADSSGAYPDVPANNTVVGGLWGTVNAIPDWPENEGLTAEQWSIPGLFVQSGRHAPDIVFARHDYAFDQTQAFFAGFAGVAADDLVTLIDANETRIEAAGVDLLSYIAPGSDHTVLRTDELYTETVNGVALLDWVTKLVAGEPVDDVHCETCTVP